MINGVDKLAITKLDVLDSLETLLICTSYRLDDVTSTDMPSSADELKRVKPIYEELPGWRLPTTDITKWDDLPKNAQKYLKRISELLNVPIAMVSIGPGRHQIFSVDCGPM